MWFRATNGDEFVGHTIVMSDGLVVYDPTMISHMNGNMLLVPYGALAKSRSFFFQSSVILHLNEVTSSIEELYKASLTVTAYVEEHFEAIVQKSLSNLLGTFEKARGDDLEEPIDADITALELEDAMKITLGTPGEFAAVQREEPRIRTRAQTINDLVKLAESKGKGKKKSG